jgi:hypothetical protein
MPMLGASPLRAAASIFATSIGVAGLTEATSKVLFDSSWPTAAQVTRDKAVMKSTNDVFRILIHFYNKGSPETRESIGRQLPRCVQRATSPPVGPGDVTAKHGLLSDKLQENGLSGS